MMVGSIGNSLSKLQFVVKRKTSKLDDVEHETMETDWCFNNCEDAIILEGVLVFHDPRVRESMNMKIFADRGTAIAVASSWTEEEGVACLLGCIILPPSQMINVYKKRVKRSM